MVEKNVEIIHNWHRLEHDWSTIGSVQCTAVHCALCPVHWIGAGLSLDCKSDWMFSRRDIFFKFFFWGGVQMVQDWDFIVWIGKGLLIKDNHP